MAGEEVDESVDVAEDAHDLAVVEDYYCEGLHAKLASCEDDGEL